jgi:plastocyanin
MKNSNLFLLGAAIATGLLLAIFGAISIPIAAQSGGASKDENQSPSFLYKLDSKYHKYQDGVFTVRAGGGGHIAPTTWFFPRVAEIKAGETVTWVNPTSVGEPHTITFVNGNNSQADFAAPFVLSPNATLTSAVPGANADPVMMPGPNGAMVVVAVNNRSLSPTVIDANGNVTSIPPNEAYSMDGTEKYVNSGWLWPSGQSPPGFPAIDTFSVKFTKAGTFNYLCEVHPWMTGQVIVK